jgi:hypothetical protein
MAMTFPADPATTTPGGSFWSVQTHVRTVAPAEGWDMQELHITVRSQDSRTATPADTPSINKTADGGTASAGSERGVSVPVLAVAAIGMVGVAAVAWRRRRIVRGR